MIIRPKDPGEIDLAKQMKIIHSKVHDAINEIDSERYHHHLWWGWMCGLLIAFSFLMLINSTTVEIQFAESNSMFWAVGSAIFAGAAAFHAGANQATISARSRMADLTRFVPLLKD